MYIVKENVQKASIISSELAPHAYLYVCVYICTCMCFAAFPCWIFKCLYTWKACITFGVFFMVIEPKRRLCILQTSEIWFVVDDLFMLSLRSSPSHAHGCCNMWLILQVTGVLLSETNLQDGTASFPSVRLRGLSGESYNVNYSSLTVYRSLLVLNTVSHVCFTIQVNPMGFVIAAEHIPALLISQCDQTQILPSKCSPF